MGIVWQGIVHDLSKYSLVELSISKYYTGDRSPHEVCREKIGYSPSWIHHYHRNKHHWQFWLDDKEDGGFVGVKMPYKYVIEMFCDMVGAGQAYNNKRWTPSAPLDYWNKKCEGKRIMHPASEHLLKYLFIKLDKTGEKAFYDNYKKNKKILEKSYKNDFKMIDD